MSYLSQIFLIRLLCATGLLTFLIWDPRESPIWRNGKSGSYQKALFSVEMLSCHILEHGPSSPSIFPQLRPSKTAKRKKSWWSGLPSSAFVMCMERLAGSVKAENVDISRWPKYLDVPAIKLERTEKFTLFFPSLRDTPSLMFEVAQMIFFLINTYFSLPKVTSRAVVVRR